jgi:hypothetical protein
MQQLEHGRVKFEPSGRQFLGALNNNFPGSGRPPPDLVYNKNNQQKLLFREPLQKRSFMEGQKTGGKRAEKSEKPGTDIQGKLSELAPHHHTFKGSSHDDV